MRTWKRALAVLLALTMLVPGGLVCLADEAVALESDSLYEELPQGEEAALTPEAAPEEAEIETPAAEPETAELAGDSVTDPTPTDGYSLVSLGENGTYTVRGSSGYDIYTTSTMTLTAPFGYESEDVGNLLDGTTDVYGGSAAIAEPADRYIQIELATPVWFSGVYYMNRGGGNGDILDYTILVSADGTNWVTATSGSSSNNNAWVTDASTWNEGFLTSPVHTKYIRIQGDTTNYPSNGAQNTISGAEMRIRQQDTAPEGGQTVSGTAKKDNTATAGITVTLTDTSSGTYFEVTSGENGAFSISNVPAGTYTLSAVAEASYIVSSESITVSSGAISDKEVTLTSFAPTIQVTVTDGDSQGVTDATVILEDENYATVANQTFTAGTDEGKTHVYSCATSGLSAGTYYVRVSKDGYSTTTTAVELSDSDVSAQKTVEVTLPAIEYTSKYTMSSDDRPAMAANSKVTVDDTVTDKLKFTCTGNRTNAIPFFTDGAFIDGTIEFDASREEGSDEDLSRYGIALRVNGNDKVLLSPWSTGYGTDIWVNNSHGWIQATTPITDVPGMAIGETRHFKVTVSGTTVSAWVDGLPLISNQAFASVGTNGGSLAYTTPSVACGFGFGLGEDSGGEGTGSSTGVYTISNLYISRADAQSEVTVSGDNVTSTELSGVTEVESAKKAYTGDTVTVTPTASDGYSVTSVTVAATTSGESEDTIAVTESSGAYSFVMPAYAVTVTVTTKQNATEKPGAVTNLTAKAGYARVRLTWTAGDENADSFKIYRAESEDALASATDPIAAVTGSDVTSYDDENLDAGMTYYYKVVATNTAGDADNSPTASNAEPTGWEGLIANATLVKDFTSSPAFSSRIETLTDDEANKIKSLESGTILAVARNAGDTSAAEMRAIFAKGTDPGLFLGYGSTTSQSKLRFQWAQNSDGLNFNTSVTLGEIWHSAGMASHTDGEIDYSDNGTGGKYSNANFVGFMTRASGDTFTLGGYNSGNYWDGDIAYVIVTDEVLTQSQIAAVTALHAITLPSETGGTVTAANVDASGAPAGAVVTLTATADTGYAYTENSLKVYKASDTEKASPLTTTSAGENAVTFVMPAEGVTVEVGFTQTAFPFTAYWCEDDLMELRWTADEGYTYSVTVGEADAVTATESGAYTIDNYTENTTISMTATKDGETLNGICVTKDLRNLTYVYAGGNGGTDPGSISVNGNTPNPLLTLSSVGNVLYSGDGAAEHGGYLWLNSTNKGSITMTFYGTGVAMSGQLASNRASDATAKVDGGDAVTMNYYDSSDSGNYSETEIATGLELGLHTVVFTNGTTDQFRFWYYRVIGATGHNVTFNQGNSEYTLSDVTVDGREVSPTIGTPFQVQEDSVLKFKVNAGDHFSVTAVTAGEDTLSADESGVYSVTMGSADVSISVTTAQNQTAAPTFADGGNSCTLGYQDTAATFTLSAEPASGTTYKVYEAATEGTEVSGVTASVNGTTLTLSFSSAPEANGQTTTYYISATVDGELESTRAAVTVTAYAMKDLTVTAADVTATYDGNAKTITVTVKDDDADVNDATITYCATQDGEYSENQPEMKNAGEYTVYYKVNKDGYNEATGSATLTISNASQEAPAENEGYTIDYSAETITVTTDYEVSATENDFTTTISSGAAVTPGATLYIRKAAKTNYDASAATTISVPARPDAPSGLSATAPTTENGSDGTITGVTTGMEYKAESGSWTDCTDTTISNLSAGTYQVRFKAVEGTSFASEPTNVTVPEYGNHAITVTSVTGGTISVDPTSAASGETVTITVTLSEGYELSTLTYTAQGGSATDITKNNDGAYTFIMPNAAVTVTATFTKITYTVTETLTNLTTDTTTSIEYGAKLELTLTPETGYKLPDTVTVTMGGETVNGAYDATTGVVTISSVTGNVEITASGVAKSSDATLSNLTLGDVTLTPAFDASTTSYTATVSNGVSSVTVAATATDTENATVSVTGADNLIVGDNTITVTVTAENGTTKEYTITVTREADKSLKSIAVDNNTVSVTTGSTATVNVTTTPTVTDDTLKVTSANASVATATIENNVVTITGVAAGTTTVTVSGTTASTVTVEITVTVTVPTKNITAVAAQTAVSVAYGTAQENLGLPEKVTVTLDDNTTTELAVTWTCATYDGSTAGDYTFTGALTLGDNMTNSGNLTASVTVTVQAKVEPTETVPVTATGYTGVYDGQSHGITVTSTVEGAEVKYGIAVDTYDLDVSPTLGYVGTLTVYYRVTAEGYLPATGYAAITIEKATVTITLTAEPNTIQSADASGRLVKFTVNGAPAGAEVTITCDDTSINVDGDSVDLPDLTKTYTFTATFEDSNYETATAQCQVVVNQSGVELVDMTGVTAENVEAVYDGSAKTITVAGAPEGAVITYCDTETGTYSETQPECVNAGTHTVYYKVSAAGYNTFSGSATVTIAKAQPTVTIVANKPALSAGGEVKLTVTAPSEGSVTVTCDVDDVAVTNNNDGTFTATLPNETKEYTFTANYAESDNYVAGSADCAVSVTQADPAEVLAADKATLESGKFQTTQENAPTQEKAVEEVEKLIAEMGVSSETTVKVVEYTAAVAGTSSSTKGTNGQLVFTVTLQKGDAEDVETAQLTMTITATAYSGGSSNSSSSSSSSRPSSGTTGGSVTTTTNDDGSVTTTVSDGKGNVTETTEQPDGTVIVVETEADGTVTATTTQPDGSKIETVTIPDEGKTITVTDAEGEVTASVSIPAVVADPEVPFVDVPEGHWAEKAINTIHGMGLVKGVNEEEHIYDMETPMTRGALVTVLHRFSNGATDLESTFEDVASDAWYAEGVAWAAKNGVVTGYNETTFAPDDPITRQQITVILYRYAKLLGVDTTLTEEVDVDSFQDVDEIGDWALDAMEWACAVGLVQGRGGNQLAPTAKATRAEVATILARFIDLLK